ncbi:MAG: polysaccharide deacetylase family protein [Clostridiales bacterium]
MITIIIQILNVKFIFAEEEALTGDGCVVLSYHAIGGAESYYNLSIKDFENQIRTLMRNNVQFITLKRLNDFYHNGVPLPKRSVLLTFDDCDETVYKNAFPILKKYGINFSIFLIMGQIGNKNHNGLSLLDLNQINEMNNSGLVEYGTHTYDMHYKDENANPIFLNLNKLNDFKQDIKLAKNEYNQIFGEDPKYFAYPYGFGTPETDYALMDENYKLILTLRYGVVQKGDVYFYVKRVLATNDNLERVFEWSTPKETIEYNINNNWGNGARVDVMVKNNGSATISNWTLTWTFPGDQKISNMQKANYTQDGSSVTVKSMNSNSTIKANSSIKFWFKLTYSGSNDKPSDILLTY